MAGNTERRNDNMTPSLTVKSNAGNNNDVILWGDPSTHALLVTGTFSISGLSGSKSTNAAAPTSDNIGALVAVASAAAPSYTEGYQVLLSTDLAGALRVTGSLSVGGTTDNSAFTAGTSTGTPAMGFYHSTVDTVTDGRSAVIGMTAKRAMFVSLYDASGNALLGQKTSANSIPVALASDASLAVTNAGTFAVQATLAAETTKVIGTVRVLGNAGAVVDGVNTAATAPANGILGLGIYNSTEPSPTTGQSVGIQLDSKGRQRMVLMDAAGNTRGANVDSSNRLSVIADQNGSNWTVNVAQINGVTPLMGAGNTGTGSPRVTLATDQAAIDLWGHGATAASVPANITYQGKRGTTALPTAVSDGQSVGAMADKFGRAVTLVGTIRDLVGTQTTTISASTSETTIVTAAGSGVFADLVMLIISNTSASTNTRIDFRDATAGSVLFSLQSNGGQPPVGFALPIPIPQTSSNNNWTAQCATSTTDIRIYAVYAKNK